MSLPRWNLQASLTAAADRWSACWDRLWVRVLLFWAAFLAAWFAGTPVAHA